MRTERIEDGYLIVEEDGREIIRQLHRPISPVPENKFITVFAFRERFTQAEHRVLNIAAVIDPAQTQERQNFASDIQTLLKDVDASPYIDLDLPKVVYGVNVLESSGLIGPGRAAVILNSPVQEHERFKG